MLLAGIISNAILWALVIPQQWPTFARHFAGDWSDVEGDEMSNGPEGVKLHRADGSVLNCELADNGIDEEGIHNWTIANATYQLGDKVTMDTLPARTSISFAANIGEQ